MTFSIVAKCANTGQFGLAISSSSPAVAARCAFAKAGVGAVATQNITNPALGPMVLEYLGSGLSASDAVANSISEEIFPSYRQLLAIDKNGNTCIHSGEMSLGICCLLYTSPSPRD